MSVFGKLFKAMEQAFHKVFIPHYPFAVNELFDEIRRAHASEDEMALPSKLEVDDYTIQLRHPKTTRNSIWIQNRLGEGMEVRLDELWKEKF